MPMPSAIERESLEAHVELCAIRYNNLEHKLGNLEHRMDKLDSHLIDIKNVLSLSEKDSSKQTISIIGSLLVVFIAGILGYIFH